MRERITMKVTRTNIRDGWQGRPGRCPVAQAAREAGFFNPDVDYIHVNLSDKRYRMPLRMTLVILAYDATGVMLPARFSLSRRVPGRSPVTSPVMAPPQAKAGRPVMMAARYLPRTKPFLVKGEGAREASRSTVAAR
jgi:hypothetical protein